RHHSGFERYTLRRQVAPAIHRRALSTVKSTPHEHRPRDLFWAIPLKVERRRTMTLTRTREQLTYRPTRQAAASASSPAESASVVWNHIPLVPQVVLVGQRDGLPVAVIDQVGTAGFRAGLCNGKDVG